MKIVRFVILAAAVISAGNVYAARHAAQSSSSQSQTATQVVAAPAVAQKVNINTAGESVLAAVNGIGPKKAAAIVAYRQDHGQFKSVSDLSSVKGMGPKVLKKVQDQLTV